MYFISSILVSQNLLLHQIVSYLSNIFEESSYSVLHLITNLAKRRKQNCQGNQDLVKKLIRRWIQNEYRITMEQRIKTLANGRQFSVLHVLHIDALTT